MSARVVILWLFGDEAVTLARRILLASALALFGLWVALHVSSHQLLIGAFFELERVAMERRIERVQAAVEDSVESLKVQAADWACWDDTYAFLGDRNPAYAASNLSDARFETLRVDLLLLLDERGDRIHGRFRPLPGAEPADPEPGLEASLPDLGALPRGGGAAGDAPPVLSGLVSLQGRPMLLAAHAVLTSSKHGPSRGILVFGRWLDGEQTQRLSRLSGSHVRVRAPGERPEANPDAAARREAGVFSLRVLPHESVTGTSTLLDIAGRPVAIIEVTIPREIVATGTRMTGYFELALTAAVGVFTALLALWIHVQIGRRIARLARVVDSIAAGSEVGARVPVSGDDEIARLAENINLLLSSKQAQERNLAERAVELHTSRVLAEAASRTKSDFLANMSHEIRTPMTAILGYADLIIGEDGNPAPASLQTDAVRTIRHNGEHLLTVINDILDLSKIEAGKMGVESLPCSPLRIVSEVRELMALRAAASKLVVALEVAYPVPAQITTDPLRLRQILVNLVGNAIKFTPAPPESPGRITIAVEAAAASDGTPRLRFRVTDTGVGLSDALRERLFTPFSQHDASTTRKFGGTGLGLAISHQLAQMLGGSLDAPRPDPGAPRGAVFELLLPISTDARMLDSPEPEQSAAVPAPAAKVRLQGRILLAEDGPDNQRLLQHVLRTAGATVHLAINGTDAVAAARGATEPFDLVLMDMQMPEMDGYEATVALRAAGIRAPIVALTAHAMAGDRERCLAAGCNDYLTKPIDRATLLSACQRWMVAQREAA